MGDKKPEGLEILRGATILFPNDKDITNAAHYIKFNFKLVIDVQMLKNYLHYLIEKQLIESKQVYI